jgi:hypothetical protein
MNDSHGPGGWPNAARELAELENAIRSAGRFVAPSRDLRPRVIEGVREAEGVRVRTRRLGTFGLVCLAILIVGMPISWTADLLRERLVAPDAAELSQRAAEISAETPDGRNWGFVDALEQSRDIRSGMLGGLR